MMKGAPDILLSRCNQVLRADATTTRLSAEWKQKLQQCQVEWATEGKRVLLLAQKTLPKAQIISTPDTVAYAEEVLAAATDLVIVGLVAIVDPPVSLSFL
jgi:sodium/potassium-transporting ATPase subunit alpha